MSGEALHTSSSSEEGWGRFPGALDLFAAVLLLPADGPGDAELQGLVARARADAAAATAGGRASVGEPTDYRLLYESARAQASSIKPAPIPTSGKTRWERVFSALGTLRHRQRAALGLYYLAGLGPAEVGRCLGLREAETRKVLESGISGIVRQLGEPADVRRSLRTAGARLISPEPARHEGGGRLVEPLALGTTAAPEGAPRRIRLEPSVDAPKPVRMPRAVVRTLLAPPIEDVVARMLAAEDPAGEAAEGPDILSKAIATSTVPEAPAEAPPLETIAFREPLRFDDLAPLPDPPAATPIVTKRREPGRHTRALALVASLVLVLAATLVPALARGPSDATGSSPIAKELRTHSAAAAPARGATAPTTATATAATATAATATATAATAATASAATATIVVERGDSLWRIAERALGDATRWPEIWALNRDAPMTDTRRFTDPRMILPGWRLRMPAS